MLLVSDDIEDLLNQKNYVAPTIKVDYYRNDLRIKKQYIATYW
jgi:hypothetical protein